MAAAPPEKTNPAVLATTDKFLRHMGLFKTIPESSKKKDFYSDLIRGLLKVDQIDRGHVTCSLTVNPSVSNPYNTLHGGAVAAVAELVGLACARTAAGDKEFFLGELNTSYLSAARIDDEVVVDGCILRQGRNVIVTSVEFRTKKTRSETCQI